MRVWPSHFQHHELLSKPRSPQFISRCVLLIGLLLLLLSQHQESLHFLVEPHVYCDVHAQLEHRGEASEFHAQGSAPEQQGERVSLALGEGHDGCEGLLLVPREKALLGMEAVVSLFARASSGAKRPVPFRNHSRRLLFRIAPKNSPPQA